MTVTTLKLTESVKSQLISLGQIEPDNVRVHAPSVHVCDDLILP